jgi:RimJ/RimL family protein N-acetyltransferase
MTAADVLPVLEAPRVRLRALADGDVDALFAIFSDEVMMRYWSTPPMRERAEAERYLASIHAGFAGRSLFQWGIERREDGEVLGTATLFNFHHGCMRAELGYCLRSPWWGRGYMGEALAALIDHAFGTLKLRRLEADVDPGNAASLRILERMGFTREGLLRERWDIAGQIGDTVFLGLLAREWRGGRT